MVQRVIKFFWLAFIAMVLPTQVLAYFTQAENSTLTSDSRHHANTLAASDLDASLGDAQTHSDAPPLAKKLASFYRGCLSAGVADDGKTPHLDAFPPDTRVISTLASHGRQRQTTFFSNARISGWKDSNAMYVALNNQF
ncbi:hypothetical protein ACODM8_16615 [Vibrio ostreicida]|uniref:Uncharacterized protein n=1 Tax=Vibrio ostreicida TaxID=526588 RepID=A0ABT8BZ53_9VIBR|nr:hypothetical protein [Vibrio ostreicida]MDN3611377.1 hypothetical protein [Vibrio ostreicida]NPD09312.1 hypothetical protein [Vibrio ostreicida]